MTQSFSLEPSRADLVLREQDLFYLFEKWLLKQVGANQLSEDTAAAYLRGLDKFRGFMASQGQEFAPERNHVIDWIEFLNSKDTSGKAKYKQNTIAAWFAGVRAFFQWGISQGLFKADPTQGVKRGRRSGTAHRHLKESFSDNEVLRVLSLSSLSPRDRALLHLLAYTGARGIELARADIGDLKTIDQTQVLEIQGKGQDEKRGRLVIASESARKALYDYLATREDHAGPLFASESNKSKGGRLSRSAIRQIVKNALRKAGIKSARKSTHSFRHTAATKALKAGADIRAVQAMLGHASVTTTEIYLKENQRIDEAAENFIKYE